MSFNTVSSNSYNIHAAALYSLKCASFQLLRCDEANLKKSRSSTCFSLICDSAATLPLQILPRQSFNLKKLVNYVRTAKHTVTSTRSRSLLL